MLPPFSGFNFEARSSEKLVTSRRIHAAKIQKNTIYGKY
jgi:hypothetical protein